MDGILYTISYKYQSKFYQNFVLRGRLVEAASFIYLSNIICTILYAIFRNTSNEICRGWKLWEKSEILVNINVNFFSSSIVQVYLRTYIFITNIYFMFNIRSCACLESTLFSFYVTKPSANFRFHIVSYTTFRFFHQLMLIFIPY